ncbi:MAG: UTP--glucose-1-phosphate uridylyltransferase [Ferrovum sp. 37-45-19]|jgi:UTP--glucose-1-phosphate uridylyltransferase|uniref:UTP--glucose-1-phosphate uridylyltransferase GalU n=1 Tax=Ferrovum sp. JA12 TaxID=1356299 RepID=UPI000702E793|nr:UTP--glucose-1-phosphate uridylyltransferase GalU [Ferrovum sp. JA12]OYV80679.1 MAG: UTP--glucose-1-phosphate uridylyltransferase [Ferrovum sp. 21-44-67]OYV95230.1 MAG: UTP--glucose-1-phosphate uridylyltransferase [Ferrovum sp. 37-45-19]OZB33750.1 MAG: UTP--glucose-1-phosphate uridylyltransferase [Ferrovum sp. 34-44-207]HQT80733.1 UTP--glucose-1-phosphate uridylyltransferase GalU [Ferrovaceae bacterium]KRH79826.1 UTP--glucose-1-phosphate uridylyltransferase [Ferrovum sp. JA12]
MKPIRKAVFPVAGLGSRFLPATKASPKEMLPIVDKPLIQYAAEEAVAAGITELIFVTGRGKRAIEDHFDKAYELEAELEQRGKTTLLENIRGLLPKNVSCVYVRQPEALGLGHAILCAESLVGDEPFAILLADDLIDSKKPVLRQMVDLYNQTGSSVLGVQQVAREETKQYGIVATQEKNTLQKIIQIVEKPEPDKAPSTLGVVGRYLLTPEIFDYLRQVQPGSGGEIQLTDGIASLLKDQDVLALPFEGIRYDCGSKLGYLKATIAFGVRHHEVGQQFLKWLKQHEGSYGN